MQSKSGVEEASNLGLVGGEKEGAKGAAEEDHAVGKAEPLASGVHLFNGRDGQADREDLELLVVDGGGRGAQARDDQTALDLFDLPKQVGSVA